MNKLKRIITSFIALLLVVVMISDQGAPELMGWDGGAGQGPSQPPTFGNPGNRARPVGAHGNVLVSFIIYNTNDPYWYANDGILASQNVGTTNIVNFFNRGRGDIGGVLRGASKGKYPVVVHYNDFGEGLEVRVNDGNVRYFVDGPSIANNRRGVPLANIGDSSVSALDASGSVADELMAAATGWEPIANIRPVMEGAGQEGLFYRDNIIGWPSPTVGTLRYDAARAQIGRYRDNRCLIEAMGKGSGGDAEGLRQSVATKVVLLNAAISTGQGGSRLIGIRDYLVQLLEGNITNLNNGYRVAAIIEPLFSIRQAGSGTGVPAAASTPLMMFQLGYDLNSGRFPDWSRDLWGTTVWNFFDANPARNATPRWFYTGPIAILVGSMHLNFNETNSSYDWVGWIDLAPGTTISDPNDIRAGWASFYVPVFSGPTRPEPVLDVIRVFEEFDELGNFLQRVDFDGQNQWLEFDPGRLAAPYFVRLDGINSERRLGQELTYNVAYRWFLGLCCRYPHAHLVALLASSCIFRAAASSLGKIDSR